MKHKKLCGGGGLLPCAGSQLSHHFLELAQSFGVEWWGRWQANISVPIVVKIFCKAAVLPLFVPQKADVLALLCSVLWGTDSSRSAWKILTQVVGAKIATLKKAQLLEVLIVSYIHGTVPNDTEVTLWDVMWGRGGWVLLTPYMIEILVKSIRTIKIYEKKPNSHTNMLTTFCYKTLAWVWADSHVIIYKNIV